MDSLDLPGPILGPLAHKGSQQGHVLGLGIWHIFDILGAF